MRPRRGRPRAGLAAALAVVGVLGILAAPLPAAPARAQAESPAPALALAAQTPYVLGGGEFAMRLKVDRGALPSPAEVVVTVYRAVRHRTDFVLSLDDRIFGAPVTTRRVNLGATAPEPNGETRVVIPVQDPDQPADGTRVDLGRRDGVHPVRVVLQEVDGSTIDGFTTHLIHLPEQHVGTPLGAAIVVPFHSPPALAPEGTTSVSVESMAAAAAAMDAGRTLPFTVAPTPETVAALARAASTTTAPDATAAAAVTALQRATADHAVLAGSFVPVNLPAMIEAGLASEIPRQLEAGEEALSGSLAMRPDTNTWVAWEPLDPPAVAELAARGVDRVLVPEADLEPLELNLTLTRPFTLEVGQVELPAAMGDAGLAAAFTTPGGPVLGAHHLLADLTVLYLDEPSADRRGVLALPPRDWQPSRAFVDVLVAGLAQNPVVAPITLDRLFADVLPEVTGRGAPLVRHLVPVETRPPAGPAVVAPELLRARGRLSSLRSILPDQDDVTETLDHRLLVAEGVGVGDEAERRSYVRAVQNAVTEHVNDIRLFQTRSITLTARQADIPMTFQNHTGHPAVVRVEIASDKLDFPDGATRQLELPRLNTTARFEVVARTSGAFPLDIVLLSPDGNLEIAKARLTVRSTAASGLSLVISAGAAAFLAIWWGRHVVRGRRARQLVAP